MHQILAALGAATVFSTQILYQERLVLSCGQAERVRLHSATTIPPLTDSNPALIKTKATIFIHQSMNLRIVILVGCVREVKQPK